MINSLCKVFDKRIKDGWFLGRRYYLMLYVHEALRFIEIQTSAECYYQTKVGDETYFNIHNV